MPVTFILCDVIDYRSCKFNKFIFIRKLIYNNKIAIAY